MADRETSEHERLVEDFYRRCDNTYNALAEFAKAVAEAARADEREKFRMVRGIVNRIVERQVRKHLREQVETYFADTYSKARYRHANDPDHRHYWEGYRDALDIAEQAVLALLGGESE